MVSLSININEGGILLLNELLNHLDLSLNIELDIPSYENRSKWAFLQAYLSERFIDLIRRESELPIPVLTASSFLTYQQTGDESTYKELYYKKRELFIHVILTECITFSKKHMESIIDYAYSILYEPCWHLPSSNRSKEDQSILPLIQFDNFVIDTAATCTGSLLATFYYIFHDYFCTNYNSLNEAIVSIVTERIIDPFITWTLPDNDSIIDEYLVLQCKDILVCTLLLPIEESKRKTIITKIIPILNQFTEHFSKDGFVSEGITYYKIGVNNLFLSLRLLNPFTGGKAHKLCQTKKMQALANHIRMMHISENRYFSVGDLPTIGPRCFTTEYIIGKFIGSKDLCNFACYEFKNCIHTIKRHPRTFLDFFDYLGSLLILEELLEFSIDYSRLYKDIYYPSSGLFISRDSTYAISVTAGSNHSPHNHNDVGNFTIYKNGEPLIIDIGYLGDYKDYDFVKTSQYHNVPIINNRFQRSGVTSHAKNVKVSLDRSAPSISMDIASTYSKKTKILSYLRTVTLMKEKGIQIRDVYEYDLDAFLSSTIQNTLISLSIVTNQEPCLRDSILSIGTLGTLTLSNVTYATIEEIEMPNDPSYSSWGNKIYHTALSISSSEVTMSIQ